MFVALLLLSVFLLIKEKGVHFFKPKVSSILAGLFLAVNYFGYMKGIELTTAGNAQVMIQMAPTLLIFIGIFYFKEKLSARQLFGVAVAVFGFYFFYQSQITNALNSNIDLLAGNLWIFIAALTWALFTTLQKTSSYKSLNHFNVVVYLFAAIALTPNANLFSLLTIGWLDLLVLFFLGLNTVIAYGCLGLALKKAPASQVSLIIILNPILTLLLLYIFASLNLDFIEPENISLLNFVGAILVAFGVGLAVIKTKKAS